MRSEGTGLQAHHPRGGRWGIAVSLGCDDIFIEYGANPHYFWVGERPILGHGVHQASTPIFQSYVSHSASSLSLRRCRVWCECSKPGMEVDGALWGLAPR